MNLEQKDLIKTNHTNLIGIHWEISSACQAACPCCPRKGENYGLADFVQKYTTKNEVEYTLNGIENLSRITFCGNIGDPMTNPEVADIAALLQDKYKNLQLTIHTNGGIGNPDKYYELGKLGARIVFGVDGLEGVNELHRANVDFKKIDRNAREYSKGLTEFKSNIENAVSLFEIQFIVWDQNIHDLPNVVAWAKEVNADSIHILKTSSYNKITDIYDNDGNYQHGLTFSEASMSKYAGILEKRFDKSEFNILLKMWETIEDVATPIPATTIPTTNNNYVNVNKLRFPKNAPYTNIDESSKQDMVINKQKRVNCHALRVGYQEPIQTYLYINYNNIVLPCCYMGSAFTRANMGTLASFARYPQPMDATEVEFINTLHELGIDKFDITKRPLVEILNDTIMDDLAFKNMFNQNKLAFCGFICGKNG